MLFFNALLLLTSCSAGIGRTGVLVAMETAMCLIERNQPVYPLDIVRKMREHRAMMVQTSVSERGGSLFPVDVMKCPYFSIIKCLTKNWLICKITYFSHCTNIARL